MLGVLIELNGLTQMAKWESSLVEMEQAQLRDKMGGGSNPALRNGNCFFYQIPYQKEESSRFWGYLERTFEYLLSRAEEYQGVTILVDRIGKTSPEDSFTKMAALRMPLSQTEAIYLTRRAAEAFPHLPETEEEGDFFLIRGRERAALSIKNPFQELSNREALREGMLHRLILPPEEPEFSGIYHLYGPPGIGKLSNLLWVLQDLQKEESFSPVLLLRGYEGEGFLTALRRMLTQSDTLQLIPFMTDQEKKIWEERQTILRQQPSEEALGDWQLLFHTLVSASVRYCEDKLLPPVLIIKNPGLFSSATRELLTFLFKTPLGEALVPVVVSEEPVLPEEWNFLNVKKMRVSPLSLIEIDRRIEAAGLEGFKAEVVKEQTRGELVPLNHLILLEQYQTVDTRQLSAEDISRALVGSLGSVHQKVVYALSLFPGLLSRGEWEAVLSLVFSSQDGLETVLDELLSVRLVEEKDGLALHPPGVEEGCELTGGEKEDIRQKVMAGMTGLEDRDNGLTALGLLRYFSLADPTEPLLVKFLSALTGLLNQGRLGLAGQCLEQFENYAAGSTDPFVRSILHTQYLRYALSRGDREMSRVRFLSFQEFTESPLTFPEALYNLETGRYHYACGEFRPALEETKKALLFMQGRGDYLLFEANANYLMGLIMMGLRRLNEGALYFNLTQEIIKPRSLYNEQIKTLCYEGLSFFLLGNHSKALRLSREAQEKAARWGRRNWELYATLLEGRIHFDLGEYGEAEKLFLSARNGCDIHGTSGQKHIFTAWMARSLCYQKRYDAALSVLGQLQPTGEVLYFTAEVLFFLKRPERALEALNLAMESRDCLTEEFAPGEYLTWRSGFSDLEDRAIRGSDGKGVLSHCIRAFRGYLLGQGGQKEEGRQELSRLIREEKICEEDPFNHFYYYLYNLVVPVGGDGESLNQLTLLSRGLKYLQLRGSQIDDTKTKQAYLNRNYWNGLLMEEGRRHKII